MKNAVRFFIENNKFTIVLSVGMLIMGLMGLSRMNAESYPSVDFAMATIITSYDGASAQDIETKITKPIEDEIRTITGLKDVRSVSQAGLSSIFVRADIDNINVEEVMSDLQRAVDRVSDLPQDLQEAPTFTEINSEEFPVFEIAITGPNKNRFRDQLADELKEELEDNKKIKSVRLTGFAQRRFQILLDPRKMKLEHIGIDEVVSKIQQRNVNIPGGDLKNIETQKLVRIEGKIKNVDELNNILIRSNFSGEGIYLKDIAKVIDDEEEIKTLTRYNGEESTLLIVSKKAGADTLELVKEVQEKLDIFKKLHGDEGINFFVYHNESIKVQNKLDVLSSNAFSGLILVIIFLFIFLPGKVGIAASISLPLAVMATLGIMPSFGMNLNAITILALVIALGMLVDNSVVISENFSRLRQEGLSPLKAATESVEQLWLPISATAFTTIAAFLPMLVTKGIMGQFIKWIPIVVTLSLLISLAESFFFLPMRLVAAGKKVPQKKDNGHVDWFSRFELRFENFMDWAVRRRYLIAGFFTIILFTSIFFMAIANKFILFPAEQTEIYIARVEMPKGTRLEVTNDAIRKLSLEVKEKLGDYSEHIVARAGTSKVEMTDPKAKDGNDVGMLIIYVNDYAKNNIAHTEILKTLRTIKPDYISDLTFEAQINGPPVGNAIEATFRSNNSKSLDEMIGKLKTEMSQVPGVLDLKVDDIVGNDEVYINIDYIKADQLGLDVNAIGNSVRTAVSGKVVSTVTLKNKDVDLMVRLQEPYRSSVEDLEKITVMDRNGNLVPLGSFAKFNVETGTPHIKRYDFKRAKTLTGDVDETKMTSFIANGILQKKYKALSQEYPDVSLKFGGAAESTKESMDSLYNALVLSLIGIFALLVFLFRSYLRPAIIMTTIPLGLLGFSIAFFLHQRPVSFLALIGIIGLGGIIVNSGIVLISFIDSMKAEGKLSLHEILVKASGMRLRAVLVTSLTTISGLIPTAYGIGGSDAMLIPMTLAMAWGLTSGTILTLVWVPCAYAILEDFTKLTRKLLKKNETNENSSTLLDKTQYNYE